MKSSLSIALLAATMLVAAPTLNTLSPLTLSADGQALAAGNGNGGGNGGGKGNAGGNSGNRGNSADHAHGGGNAKSSAGKSNSAAGKKAGGSTASVIPAKKSSKATVVASNAKPATAAAPKTKNIHAQLKGLNSLKRNINGMMNSADPRMADLRAYIAATGNLQAATTALATADKAVTDTKATLDGLTQQKAELEAKIAALPDGDPTLPDLQQQLADLDAQITTATADYNKALADQTTAQASYDAAVLAAGSAPTLDAAIAAAQSPNTELNDDAMNWAKDQVNRLVTDYVAKL